MTATPRPFDLAAAVRAARVQYRGDGASVLDALLRHPELSRDQLVAKLTDEAGVAVLLAEEDGAPDYGLLDGDLSRQWRCVLIRRAGATLLACEDPWDETLLRQISRKVGVQLTPAAATGAALTAWLGRSDASPRPGADSPVRRTERAPVVAFVDQAMTAAFELGASDIHFECDRIGINVRHRLDGVMSAFAQLDGVQQAEEVISRIKVLAQLDITERRLPQDGRFRFEFKGVQVDMRVSIMPSVHGEDAVLRVLDKARLRGRGAQITLDLLGFEPNAALAIRELATAPSGMLLVTGPTGSGKTTTLYATLSEINKGLEKVVTIEDPVEYELKGVLQIPVNERKGLTFARGLRSVLRHDPDRILVGEIRDAETAEIAVQSALTGHLVFTTVHANSVTDVVGRFRHFGLDMFGFMSSLNGVVVQRLIRRICPACAGSRDATPGERQWLAANGIACAVSVPHAVGCASCHGSGYSGRFVIAEVHHIDDALRDHITAGAPLAVLKAHAAAQHVEALAAQAARHVLAQRTTTEEVRRVVGWQQ